MGKDKLWEYLNMTDVFRKNLELRKEILVQKTIVPDGQMFKQEDFETSISLKPCIVEDETISTETTEQERESFLNQLREITISVAPIPESVKKILLWQPEEDEFVELMKNQTDRIKKYSEEYSERMEQMQQDFCKALMKYVKVWEENEDDRE